MNGIYLTEENAINFQGEGAGVYRLNYSDYYVNKGNYQKNIDVGSRIVDYHTVQDIFGLANVNGTWEAMYMARPTDFFLITRF